MARQKFILFDRIGPKIIGEREIPDYSDLGAGARLTPGYAFFCPHCESIWGKIKVESARPHYMQPINSSCPDHATFPSDGTFTSQYGAKFPDDPRGVSPTTPPEVLRHDVIALCTYYLNHPDKIFLLHFES